MTKKSNNKKNRKEKTQAPDFLQDAVDAVRNYDDVRLKRREIKNETLESLHKKAVKCIVICNNIHGKGHTSISKARTLIDAAWRETKIKNVMDSLKCEREEALDHIAKQKAA